jgi:hypothetical protein
MIAPSPVSRPPIEKTPPVMAGSAMKPEMGLLGSCGW